MGGGWGSAEPEVAMETMMAVACNRQKLHTERERERKGRGRKRKRGDGERAREVKRFDGKVSERLWKIDLG